MRITHIYPFIHRRGGIERYVVDLIHHQAAHHEITLIAAQVEWDELPTKNRPRWIPTPCIRIPGFLVAISFCIANLWTKRKVKSDLTNSQGASAFSCDV